MQVIEVENLQTPPQAFIDHIIILGGNEGVRIEMSTTLKEEYSREEYRSITVKLVTSFQKEAITGYRKMDESIANVMIPLRHKVVLLSPNSWTYKNLCIS